ncbi:MAG: tetratricopeptide repeat protein [Ectothiorhodospiraceae bacterium]
MDHGLQRYVTGVIVALLTIPLFMATAQAVPMNPGSEPAFESLFGAPAGLDDESTSQGLEEVVNLLQENRRGAAKRALAAYLRDSPGDARGWELSGLIFMGEQRLEAARGALQRAVSLDPQGSSAMAKLAVVLLQEGEVERGEAGLRQTLALDPDNHLALAYLAWLEQRRGEWPEARALYSHLLTGSGWEGANGFTQVHVAYSGVLLQLGDHAGVVALLEPHRQPGRLENFPAASVLLAIGYLESGRVTDARQTLDEAAERLPQDHPVLQLATGMLEWAEGRPQEALSLLSSLAEEHPQMAARAHTQRARIAMAVGEEGAAVDALSEAARSAPASAIPRILENLVGVLADRDGARAAADLVSAQLARYPDDVAIHETGGELQLRLGRNQEAFATAERLVELQPDRARSHLLAGAAAAGVDQHDRARQHYRQAIEMDPGSVPAWTRLAALDIAQDDMAGALDTLTQGQERNPENLDLAFERGTVLDLLGHREEANAVYRRIVAVMPEYYPALNNLSWNLLVVGTDATEAQRLAAQALALRPQNPTIQETYGRSLLQGDDIEGAITALEQALQQSPESAVLRDYLDQAREASSTAQSR